MRIGHNLRRVRNVKGWSQEVLARMVNMSQSNLSNIGLTHPDSIVLNIETQQGGNANNYVVNNGTEGEVATLKDRIRSQEEEIRFLRQQLERLTEILGEKN